jgi:hypothetical protein
MQKKLTQTVLILLSAFATHTITAKAAVGQLLWDNWYIVRANGTPKAYYNEHAEIAGDKIRLRVNTWEREGTKLKSENLGATAKNSPQLTPQLYHFRTFEAGIEKTIDGTVMNNGKVFSFKIKRGSKTLNPLRAQMIPNIFLSSFFPVWLHLNMKKISSVQPKEFTTIREYDVENSVLLAKGDAYEMMPDDFSKQTGTRKIRVNYNQVVNFWYITPKGEAIRILSPAIGMETRKSTREEAEKSL